MAVLRVSPVDSRGLFHRRVSALACLLLPPGLRWQPHVPCHVATARRQREAGAAPQLEILYEIEPIFY